MGTVYEAVDAEERHVALKLLHPAFSVDESARERLRREVATLHRVRGDSVARVLDAEAEADEAFIVTELIDGQSLEDSVHEHGPFDPEELCDLAEGLARALESIHQVGVLHRDLKPGNVMLTDDGPVVIDFGISQLADDARITQTGLVTGTPGYVDPNVMHGKNPTRDGDWWGWAAVLVFAATGRQPFGRGPGVLMRVDSGRVDTTGLPPRIAQVLRRALHPDPDRRMSPEAVRAALSAGAQGRDVTSLLSGDDPTSVTEHTTVTPGPLPPTYAPGAPAGAASPRTAYLPAGQAPQAGPAPAAQPAPVAGTPGAPPEAWGPMGADGGPMTQVPAWMRAPRPRPGIALAWLVAVVGWGTLAPAVALLGLCGLLIVLGSVGASTQSLRRRRVERGLGRWDRTWATAAFPVHLLEAVLLMLPGVIVAALGAAVVWILGVDALPNRVVLPAAVAVAALLLWWTPSSGRAREGQRVLLRRLAPSGAATAAWVALGVVIGLVGFLTGLISLGAPHWFPFPAPPTSFF